MKTIAFVPVRLTSSRLPEKHLRIIGDRSLLAWVIQRLKDAVEVDQIVICAPDEPETKRLKEFSRKEGLDLFIYKGDVNDVVGRLTQAAEKYQAEICVLASGDCPLISSPSLDILLHSLKRQPDSDMICFADKDHRFPVHEGVMIAKRWVWELADQTSCRPELREHQFPIIGLQPELFRQAKRTAIVDQEIYYQLKHRFSVDTWSDLEFMNRLYAELTKRGKRFRLNNAIEYLLENPGLMDINKSVCQLKIGDKTYNAMFYVTAVENYGYGNLTRAMEVASTLINKYGYGVQFIVFDSKAKRQLQLKGFKAWLKEEYHRKPQKPDKNIDIIIFDIHKDHVIDPVLIKNFPSKNKAVIFIDNVKKSAKDADLIIIPTAHYIGEEYPNLKHGKSYVVIRKEIQRVKPLARGDKAGLLIYRQVLDNRALTYIENETENLNEKNIETIDSFTPDFPEKLARAKYYMAPLGISMYEAFYLGATCLILPADSCQEKEIDRFRAFMKNTDPVALEKGAENIVNEIVSLVESLMPQPEERAV